MFLVVAGCDRGEYQPRSVVGAYFDLAAEHRYSDRWVETEALRISDPAARSLLARGWSLAEERGVWAQSSRPMLRFWIAEPGPRRISFHVSGGSADAPRAPRPARFALNGTPAGEFRIEDEQVRVELALPAELQRAGLNELAFEIEGGIRPILAIEGNEDLRLLTGFFSDIAVERLDEEQHRRLVRREQLVPGGSRIVLDGGAIEQASGCAIRHALRLPADAVFESELFAVDGMGAVRFLVRLRDDEGTDVLVVDETLDDRERARLVSADLSPYAGRAVELELSLCAPGDAATPVSGLWGRPVLLGEPDAAPPLPRDVTAALERARARLASAPVVVVLLDACNPEFVSAYGGRDGLTPNLDRLAREGKRFDRAFSAAAYTTAAVASILTSAPTWRHGAWKDSTRLADSVETWAERFAAAGYRTAGIVCSGNGSSTFGYERGFAQFLEVFRGLPKRRPLPTARDVLSGLDAVLAASDGRPPMLWIHLLEPHEPYGFREPGGPRLDPDYEGTFDGATQTIVAIREWRLQPGPRDVEHLEALYEEGLAYGDHVFGRIRERLERHGIWEDAVVVVLSDHGEAFLAHRSESFVGMGHNSSTYSDMTRIPLIVRLPDGAGLDPEPTSIPVGNLDVFTTIADLVGVPLPPSSHGKSFAPVLFGADRAGRRRLLVHSTSVHAERFQPELALVVGHHKYVSSPCQGDALYDLSRDLAETEDLLPRLPVLGAVLRQDLRRLTGLDPATGELRIAASEPTRLDDEVLRQLEALGYTR